MVDWIMTFAWPFVKDLRAKVTLGGILNNDTKDKWNGLLALPAKDKARVIDRASEEEAILSTPASYLAPDCSCRTPCRVQAGDRHDRNWPWDAWPPADRFDCEDDNDGDDVGRTEDVENAE